MFGAGFDMPLPPHATDLSGGCLDDGGGLVSGPEHQTDQLSRMKQFTKLNGLNHTQKLTLK